ncbi:hypothetical protein CPB83DRAFT_854354 [Crepidotus variabilis]|uniref:Uncharacterized protein n=1 Tax=Crepidotus variabilis TaxID=179855 RepID=A0A9P6EFF6_9AGAR|nr:hypothetical protein CPB83DRAFT_854354 [Crepidotus variabilis]
MSFRFLRSLIWSSRHAVKLSEKAQAMVQPRFRFSTLVAVGAASYVGGMVSVPIAGYAIYYASGLKKAVDTFSPAMQFLMGAKEQMKTDKVPSHILGTLRKAVKAYVAYIPGASFVVDRTFDKIDETADRHEEEANAIIGKAYMDIFDIVKHGGNNHETHSAVEIFGVCRRLLEDLRGLGQKAGTPLVQHFELDKHAETVGNKVQSVRDGWSERYGSAKPDDGEVKPHGSIGQLAAKASGTIQERFSRSFGKTKDLTSNKPSEDKSGEPETKL